MWTTFALGPIFALGAVNPFDGTVSVEDFSVEELRRKNPNALAMDVLYLFVTGFFVHLMTRGVWPALIAVAPLAGMLVLGYRASIPFFVAQVLTAVLAVGLTVGGIL